MLNYGVLLLSNDDREMGPALDGNTLVFRDLRSAPAQG